MICFEWFGQNSENVDRNETPLIENWQPKAADSNYFIFIFFVKFLRVAPNIVRFEKMFDAIRIDDVKYI